VAEGAGDSNAGELPCLADLASDADYRVQPQQFDRNSGIIQIDLSGRQRLPHSAR
jgi:hypothetical protein